MKRVLSIQSHVVSGYVGNKAATFPLQLLGFEVDALNSVQFSNHTGYPVFKGQVLNGDQLLELVDGLDQNNLLGYTHVLTGYIGSVSFLQAVEKVVDKIRKVNPNVVYVCDPVMGDDNKLYVPKELTTSYGMLLKQSKVITPNYFEAEILTGIKITTLEAGLSALDKLHNMGPDRVVITSSSIGGDNNIITLLASARHDTNSQEFVRFKLEMPKIDGHYTGCGDLLSALVLAWTHNHPSANEFQQGVEKAVASMQAVIAGTHEVGARELRIVQSKSAIEDPKVNIKGQPLGV